MRPKVYVTNKSSHDFSKADEFGDIVFLTEGYIPWDKSNLAYRQMVEVLKDSQPEDFLLLSGPISISSVAAAIFGHLHGRVNLLVYDTRGFYRRFDTLISSMLNE